MALRPCVLLLAALLATMACACLGSANPPLPQLPADLQGALDKACNYYSLPGMCGAIITPENSQTAVSGMRKLGSADKAQIGDLWHLGSNTKAFTATLAG